MADLQLLINKLNQADEDSVIQQNESIPNNNVDILLNKLNSKNKDVEVLNENLIKGNTYYNENEGQIIATPHDGFDGFTDIKDIENEAELYADGFNSERVKREPGTFMDGIKGAGNDLLYGYLNSASSFYNTLANIPGGFRKLSEFANSKFGNSIESVYQEDPEKGLTYAFEVAENYLRGLSVQLNPHSDNPYFNKNMTFNMKPTTPDTFLGKLYSAFGAAPVTVGEYIPATRLLKSMPLGFATTDALRAADQGVEEAGVAGLKGLFLGKVMKQLEPFNIKTRVAAMSTLGFGASDGNLEDKLVGAITFGTLSAMGRIDGKTIGEARADLNSYLSGRDYRHNKLIRELEVEGNKQINVIEGKTKELAELNEQIVTAKDAINKGEKSVSKRELNSMEKRFNKLEGDIYTLRDNYNKTNAHIEMSKNYLDLRSTEIVVNNLLRPVKVTKNKKTKKKEYEYEPTEKDIEVKGFKGLLNEFIFQAAPARFVSKAFPNSLFKKGIDLVTQNRISAENTIDALLRNPTFNKADPYFINIIKGLTPKSGKQISLLPASQYAKTGKDPNSIEAILETNSKYLNSVVEKLPAIEKFATKNKKNKQLFKKSEGDVTVNALKKEFKFNDNQVLVYKTLRKGLRDTLNFYNEMGVKYGGSQFKPIKELPSYFPHIWMADFRIFVRKKSNNELVAVLPANNKATAKLLQKKLESKLDGVKTQVDAAQRTGDMQVNVFAETMNFLRNNKKLAKEVRDAFEANYIKTGFNVHSMPRKQKFVDGYLGGSTKIYKDLGVPEGIARMKNTSDFVKGYIAYIQGAVRAGHQIKLRRELKTLTMDPQLSKHYQNTINFLNRYYSAVFSGDFASLRKGEAKSHPLDRGLENTFSRFLGANGLDKFVNSINSFTLTTRLLMFNMRFAQSQIIQPYQMILPQLSRFQAIGEGGSVMTSFFKSQKDLINPSKEAKEVIQTAVKNRAISAAFIDEFKSAIRGKTFSGMQKFLDAATGKGFSARLEQFSRMNATLMFYHSLREGGMNHKNARDRAWQLADTYMVEYNATQRPMLYGSSGFLGRTAGKTFGLFKTFQHNYLAQMVEHVRTTQQTGDFAPTASFVTSMVFTAGLYGTIGVEVADFLLSQLDKTAGALMRKTGLMARDQKIPTFSEWLYGNNLHPFLLFGGPSYVTGQDLTATLSAPAAIGLDAIFTLPPGIQLFLNVGTATKNYMYKYLEGIDSSADRLLFYNSFAPNIFKPFLEAYFNAELEGESIVEYLVDSQTGENRVVIVGAGDKVRSKINRDLNDWYARLFSSYSLKEAYINKVTWHLTKIKNKKQIKEDDFTEFAAIAYLKTRELPRLYVDYMVGQGYNGDRIYRKIYNKIKDLSKDIISKNLKGELTRDKMLLGDIIANEAFDLR